MKNLIPFIQDKLCMFNISSLDELRCLGRRAEAGRLRSTTIHPPPRPNGVLESDLAFPSNRRRPILGNVALMNSPLENNSTNFTPRKPSSRPLKCWNGNEDNHVYRDCTKERKIFCFGCGEADVKKSSSCKSQAKKRESTGTAVVSLGVLPVNTSELKGIQTLTGLVQSNKNCV